MSATPAEISVVIPARNAARTLPDTLASIRAQSLSPGEVIVADDGSQDDTAALAAAAGARVLRLPPGGPSRAVNAGVAAAQGALLAFCDADDLWLPEKLARQTAALAATGAPAAALCHVEAFPCPSLSAAERQRLLVPPGAQPGWMRSCLLIGRAAFERVGPLEESLTMGEMIDWFDRARLAGVEFALLPETLVRRRLHPGSHSHAAGGRHARYLEMARRALARRRQESA